MYLLPVYSDDRPLRHLRLLDQQFDMGLDNMFHPYNPSTIRSSLDRQQHCRPWRCPTGLPDSKSTVCIDKDKFQVNLDVQHFMPEEITVKVTGKNTITIQAKHEEKKDEHGYISREFVRRYIIPEGHDIAKVESKLSSDGVLTITAPSIAIGDVHRSIPIQQVCAPLKTLQKNEKVE